MMQIDRSNYELWLIDWLDGNLNESQIQALMQFLDENPDLKEETEELNFVRLLPTGARFKNKHQLKKNTTDLSDSQFEYLCAAYLENDLSEMQIADLKVLIGKDPEKKKIFDGIQKTKLTPATVKYKRKNNLIKRTLFEKAFRISLIALPAAAIVAIIILTYVSAPRSIQIKDNKIASSEIIKNITNPTVDGATTGKEPASSNVMQKKSSKKPSSLNRKISFPASNSPLAANTKDTLVKSGNREQVYINKIQISHEISTAAAPVPDNLIALNSGIIVTTNDDGRSKISKFIAKAFRETFLKEKTPKDSPLQVYEIAKASVSGLNKLLGWDMALDEKKDMYGDPKSVYFSSKLLKFNAPIKKTGSVR